MKGIRGINLGDMDEDDMPEGLKELLAKLGGRGDKDKPHPLRPEVQVEALLNALPALTAKVTYTVGDILRGRKEFVSGHIKNWEEPHMVVEILSEPVQMTLGPNDIGFCNSSKRYTMVVANVQPDGMITYYYAEPRDWELHPDAAKLKPKQHS